MNYTTFETKASLWKASDSTRQPVVLITREDTPHPSRRGTPITEEQIRAMYAQMGRKPSEQQVRQIMNNFKRKIKENNK